MSLLLKASNSHLFLPSSIASMATCSSFCAQLPISFRPIPISSSFPTNQPFKPFSAKASISPANDDGSPITVGFLGLGIMGSPMALNLIKSGCDVTVWNRTKSKCDPLISMGAKYKPSPEEVTAACDVTFAMLADPESAMEVACGKHGAVSGMGPGKGVCGCFNC
ncbi:hypothetical protein OIU77_027800 [Salix suchowensis]|uniref:6-phosphogluconate dehydrogenase NADP-binding domain-containing protein n=1 Tax=Salix suchowensis TaxID=1278906 RepID=A0ABQ9BQX2_9ROSI|nr:hypothetical protein OIU77_027800 [Salix suchowensis]